MASDADVAVTPESVAGALARATTRLGNAGIDTPRLDAELLLAEVSACDRARLVLDAREPLEPAVVSRFDGLIERRAAREPVAYLLGTRPFRRLELAVDPRVLIPRPETELLVEVGVELLPLRASVADVGTGSGAIALALADERPDLHLTGIDASEDALAVARANAERLGLTVEWRHGDLLPEGADFDAVIANLPYVETHAVLAPEILSFEPAAAVFGGADGLDLIRRLVGQVAVRADVALLALEIGSSQGDAVMALLREAGYAQVERRRDLAGNDRVVLGRR